MMQLLIEYMGNQQSVDSLHGEVLDFSIYLKQATQHPFTPPRKDRGTLDEHLFHPEKRWRVELLDSLEGEKENCEEQNIVEGIREIIKSIEETSFIKAVSVLHFLTSSSKKAESKPLLTVQKCMALFVNDSLVERSVLHNLSFDQHSATSKSCMGVDLTSTSATQSQLCTPEKRTFRNNLGVKKNLPAILRKEISQEYHPIQKISQQFLLMLKMKYRSKLDHKITKQSYSMERLTEEIQRDFAFYTSFISNGCRIYKSLLLKQASIRQSNYHRYIKSVLIESMFERQKIKSILYPIVLELSGKSVRQLMTRIPDHVSITTFPIKPELCIEGMFLNSLMLLSDIDRHLHPSEFYDYLEKIKNQICSDIDKYNRAIGSEKSFKIDGENMLGIVCFLLCRMKPKLKEIFATISLFNAIQENDGLGNMGVGEYMLTTFNAAFELLSTEFFAQ